MHSEYVCIYIAKVYQKYRLYLIVRPEISTALVASEQHSTSSQPVSEHQCY